MPGVARRPMVLVLLFSTAGLIAGTTPTIGIEEFCLNDSSAIVLAVLQAITISFTSKLILILETNSLIQ